jgi:hypothetical protein
MSEQIFCVYQLIRPSKDEKGKDNCIGCEPDEHNKLCKDYRPIKLQNINDR